MKKRLFFDLETTGLPKNWAAPTTDVDNWPHIVQIAWILYIGERKVSSNDFIIKPQGFKIPEESSKIHRITNEIASEYGFDIGYALKQMIADIRPETDPIDEVIAHNISFDRSVFQANYFRTFNKEFRFTPENVCTMRATTNICKIPSGRGGYKWPKLQELHNFLFGCDFEDAHDALADIEATAKCYFELKKRGLI